LLSNRAITGDFALTPGGTTIAFTRLVDDGIVKRYLEDKCPNAEIRACAYGNDLPQARGDWLWDEKSPLEKLGGWEAYQAEAEGIILESIALYPGLHLKFVLSNTMEQVFHAATGDGLVGWMWHTSWAISQYAPQTSERFLAARQQTRGFDFGWLNAVHIPVYLASLAVLPILVWLAGTRVRRPAAALALFVFTALLCSAAICGILASPYDRYQSRLAFLASLAVGIAAFGWRSSRRRIEDPSSATSGRQPALADWWLRLAARLP
jgi:hypothetical protein